MQVRRKMQEDKLIKTLYFGDQFEKVDKKCFKNPMIRQSGDQQIKWRNILYVSALFFQTKQ